MGSQRSFVPVKYARKFSPCAFSHVHYNGCSRNKTIVDEVTTLRRHLEANHSVCDEFAILYRSSTPTSQGKYRDWAKGVNFTSKLPGDVKKRKEAAEEITRTLDRDLREKKLSERVVPYSDKLFHRAAIEWLVATDQVGNPLLLPPVLLNLPDSLSKPLSIPSSRR